MTIAVIKATINPLDFANILDYLLDSYQTKWNKINETDRI